MLRWGLQEGRSVIPKSTKPSRIAWPVMLLTVAAESEEMRSRRRQQRSLFDGVAERYQDCRRGYPPQLVQFIADTAGLKPGSAVLEVGCGTGQLTGQLAAYGFAVTAIDIGASMIAVARRRFGRLPATFVVACFEGFDVPDASFDLIISATAFHWIDPEVKFTKPARLLKAEGWLALLATGERYSDPFGAVLREMWLAHSDGPAAWDRQHKDPAADLTGAGGSFGPPVERSVSQPMVLPAETVIGVETTRATFLSWPEHTRRRFAGDLRHLLPPHADVHLTQETSLAMAQVLPRA